MTLAFIVIWHRDNSLIFTDRFRMLSADIVDRSFAAGARSSHVLNFLSPILINNALRRVVAASRNS